MFTVEGLRKDGYKVRVLHHRHHRDVVTPDVFTRKEIEALNHKWSNVTSKGGFTLVEVTTPEGLTLKGKFNFGSNRPYNKKLGVTAALGRAMKNGGS